MVDATTLLALATLVGLAASIMGYVDYKKGGQVCELAEDVKLPSGCASVYLLPEAMIAGTIHLSEAAPIYFGALTALTGAFIATGDPRLLKALIGVLAIGAALVPYLIYLEIAKAKALCLFCTIMHVSIISGLVLALRVLTAS